MKGGNISNAPATAVALRFERVVRTEEGKLNRSAKAYMEGLFGQLDINLFILTTGNARKAMAFCLKWGLPYAKVVAVDSTLEIPLVCQENRILTYHDLDKDVIANVNARSGHITKAYVFEQVEVA